MDRGEARAYESAILLLCVLLFLFAACSVGFLLASCCRNSPRQKPQHVNFMDDEANQAVQAKLPPKGNVVRYNLAEGPERTSPCNMSYFFFRGKHYLIVRYIFYKLRKSSLVQQTQSKKNYNALYELDSIDSKNPRLVGWIRDHASNTFMETDNSNGLEDMRALVMNDKVFVVGTSYQMTYSPGKNSAFVAELNLDRDTPTLEQVFTIITPEPKRVEKNWIPIAYNCSNSKTKLCAIYKLFPLQLVDLEQGEQFEECPIGPRKVPSDNQMQWLLRKMLGSSNFCEWKGHLVGVAHQSAQIDGHKHYSHYWILLDKDLNVMGVSDPFTFEGAMVEFCTSLHVNNQNNIAYLWYSVMDAAPSMVQTDLDKVRFHRVEMK